MSITFSIQPSEATPEPMKKVYTSELYPGLDDDHFECDPWMKKDEQGYYEMRSEWPDAQFANGNARAVFDLLKVEFDYCGLIPHAEIAGLKRSIIGLRNKVAPFDAYTRGTVVEGACSASLGVVNGDGSIQTVHRTGPTIIHCGVGVDYFDRAFDRLLKVLDKAQEMGLDIGWS